MSFPKKRRRAKVDGDESFLAVLRHFKPFGQLDTKIARARAQDEPVLYAHVLPGLDVLLCSVRGAHPPYPAVAELRRRCIESKLWSYNCSSIWESPNMLLIRTCEGTRS